MNPPTLTVFGQQFRLLSLWLTLLAAQSAGSAELTSSADSASATLWRSRDLYVRLEAQERAGAPPPANSHPANLSPGDLRVLLSSVQVRLPDAESPAPVFTDAELAVLGDTISRGLSRATPQQDIIFAIAGYRRVVFGTLKEARVTTGRIFYVQGHLNIIFRDVQGKYKYLSDRRLDPLLPGSRYASTNPSWTLVPQPGQELYTAAGERRRDWLLLDPEIILTHEDQAAEPAERTQRLVEEADQLRQQLSEGQTAQQELKQQVEALQKDIRTLQQKKPSGEQPPPPPNGNARPAQGRSYEERLSILRHLRDKGLVTEQEYEAKRRQILEEI